MKKRRASRREWFLVRKNAGQSWGKGRFKGLGVRHVGLAERLDARAEVSTSFAPVEVAQIDKKPHGLVVANDEAPR